MAIRAPRPKHLRSFRRLNAAARGSSSAAAERIPDRRPRRRLRPSNPAPGPKSDPILNFNDSKALFSSVPTLNLVKSAAILRLSASSSVAELGSKILTSDLMEAPLFRKAVLGVTRHTFYDHFCGGEDLKEAGRTVKELWEAGLSAMLDYGLEHAGDNESCDRNLEEFVRTIGWTTQSKALPVSSVPKKKDEKSRKT